jgi:putative ABC transport system ATP-binding protein
MKTIIKLSEVYKIYNANVPNEVKALNGISLEIKEGEFTAVVGPSGSGKTTLLNCIGGLDKPDKGSVNVDDIELVELKENELINFRLQHIGFVFQSYNLIPVLTAKENVGFVMLLQDKKKGEIEKRVMELLGSVGLKGLEDKRPNQMSGGQQQRVAVARALASKPRFILADEPTANLDSKSTNDLLDVMEKLNKNEGITFLFSTHDQRVIDRAHRVIEVVDGTVAADKTIK